MFGADKCKPRLNIGNICTFFLQIVSRLCEGRDKQLSTIYLLSDNRHCPGRDHLCCNLGTIRSFADIGKRDML